MKKIAVIALIAVMFAMVFCVAAVIPEKETDAQAAPYELAWEPALTYRTMVGSQPVYNPFASSVASCSENEVYIFISGWQNNHNYFYCVSTELKSTVADLRALGTSEWTLINPSGDTNYETYDDKNCLITSCDVSTRLVGGIAELYFYFLHTYSDGASNVVEYYAYSSDPSASTKYWNITFNVNNSADNEFNSISAIYDSHGSKGVKYEGAWTANPITFSVVTKNMATNATTDESGHSVYVYSTNQEILSYSEDFDAIYRPLYTEYRRTNDEDRAKELAQSDAAKRANWRFFPEGNGTVSISKSINGICMWFRLTDIANLNPQFAYYGTNENGVNGEIIPIRLDPETPSFNVSAQTYSVDSTLQTWTGEWTSNPVRFTLTDQSKCISDITYQYSINGGTYVTMPSTTFDTSVSIASLMFRATSVAGKIFYFNNASPYVVKIDSVVPQVRTDASTIDPDNPSPLDACDKKLSSTPQTFPESDGTLSMVTVYDYANNKVEVRVYNRDSEGNAITNTSGVKFYYQDATERSLFTNTWQEMTDYETIRNERCYIYSLTIGTDVTTTRYVQFRIRSGAGIISDPVEVCVSVANSSFTFRLMEEGYLIANYNADGWISDKATIRALLSADSREYPTTQYSFYYWTDELTGEGTVESKIKAQANSSAGTPVEFYEEKNGIILWIYEFNLENVSANAIFNIRAMNAAKKLNADTVQTYDIIRIDVKEPSYTWNAYIYPPTGEITAEDMKNVDRIKELSDSGKLLKIADKESPDAGWVNGSIYLVLCVDVGVSGINLKDMAYAKDTAGNAMYDTSGNLVWQELTGVHQVDTHITTVGRYGQYYYFINLNNNDSSKIISVQDYRYRIYTGSGISTDVSFTAKFDSTDSIRLTSVKVEGETGKNVRAWNVTAGGDTVLSDGNFAVCENFAITFTSSLDRAGIEDHYDLYYYPFVVEDMGIADGIPSDTQLRDFAVNKGAEDITSESKNYMLMTEGSISQLVSVDRKGFFYFAFYVKSKTRDYQNVSNVSGYYVLCVEYDTLNITIAYGLDVPLSSSSTDEDDMIAGVWKTGALEVKITLPTDDSSSVIREDAFYTFYYMLIEYGVANTNDLLSSDVGWHAAIGDYDGDHRYVFQIPFSNMSFYGTIGLSVCNKAMYRSIGYSSNKIVRIDNTTPDLFQIIKGQTATGITEETTAYGRKIVSINTMDEISLNASAIHSDNSHAPISFYYMYLTALPDSVDKITHRTSSVELLNLGDNVVDVFTLGGAFSRLEPKTVYLMLFAINTVATPGGVGYSGSTEWSTVLNGYEVTLTTVYAFNYDPSELEASPLTPGVGASYSSLNMYEFLYLDRASVSTTVTATKRSSEEPDYYRIMFSVDNGETWFDYLESGAVNYYTLDENKEIVFTADSLKEYERDGVRPFENGVLKTFKIRAVNKAGAIAECGSIYIAIDETTPEFTVRMYDQYDMEYIGGSNVALDSRDENWTNGPVTVCIDITRMPASGVRVYYDLLYNDANGHAVPQPFRDYNGGRGKELLNYEQFTTDRLDGFDVNRDAIVKITVVSRSGSASTENKRESDAAVRISVDQQVPYFSLTGRATQENDAGMSVGDERYISSGDWTDLNTVSVYKEVSANNVSNVVYTYTWQSESMAEPDGHTWSSSESSIVRHESGKLIVTAISANGDVTKGRSYTREFDINIDTTPPTIEFTGGINVIEGSEQYIDLQVVVHGDNLDIVEYITIKENTRGFTFDPTGYVLSTSSVDNSLRHAADEPDPDKLYRGYVHIYIRDKAGHEQHFEMYVVPFPLTVNTIQLTDEDKTLVDELEHTLELANNAGYMEKSRVEYFESMISRLRDRMETLQTEIDGYRDYLEKLANRSSFELRSDYAEMLRYRTTFQNYEVYGQKWIQTAITGDSTSKYYAYYKNFLNQFDRLFALMEQVEKVEKHVTELPAINMVETEDYTDILRVYDEYYDLTQDQRSCFTSNLYNKLMDLKEACEVLLLSDRETGVVIDGDFAPGATIAVTKYGENTDTYQNAQTLLMNTVDKESPRAVVSIHRVALTGAYAQTAASDISVQIPIPAEYRSYIEFSVYALADDGSMKKVSGSKIQPDGESVIFTTATLGTYVLCVKADMQATETSSDTYGSVLGIPLTATMIKYILYIGGGLFGIIFLVCIILGLRQRRFMNSYNRAYRNSVYRKHSKGIPKGNRIR